MFLKKGHGISVLRFEQLWDCVSFEIHSVFGDLLSFWDCLSFDIVSVKIFSQFWNCLSFEIVSVLILSQFWNCLSFEYSYRIAVLDLKSIFSLVASTQIFSDSLSFQSNTTKLLISEFDDFVSTHIFSEFYQNSLKDLHLDKIITISWLLLSYSENIENNWNYVRIWCKVTKLRW